MKSENVIELMSGLVGLTPTQRSIVMLMKLGVTQVKELSKCLGVTERCIQKALQQLRNRTTERLVDVGREPKCANLSSVTNCGSAKSETRFATRTADTRARAYKESPSEINLSRISFSTPFDKRVRFEQGRLVVCDEVRLEWVSKFESVERFELALVQAQGFIQPNSPRPLEAQLAAQLARSLADKLDRDARYAKSVAQKVSTQSLVTTASRAVSSNLAISRETHEALKLRGLV